VEFEVGDELGLALGETVGAALGWGLLVGLGVGSKVSTGGAKPNGAGVGDASRQIPRLAIAPRFEKRTVIFITSCTSNSIE
jgi:hypothetical protein